jgi:hypothetical protein
VVDRSQAIEHARQLLGPKQGGGGHGDRGVCLLWRWDAMDACGIFRSATSIWGLPVRGRDFWREGAPTQMTAK